MKESEYLKKQIASWEETFKDHKVNVSYSDNDNIIFTWNRVNGTNYWLRAAILKNFLCIVGDLFEATYSWSEIIDIEFLASTNFDYFAGKLRASESGRKWQVWHPQVALARKSDLRGSVHPKFHDQLSSAIYKEDFEALAYEVYERDSNAEMASEVREAGLVPAPMLIGHWMAMRLIHKQLTPVVT